MSETNTKRCVRCGGRKELYKVNGAYSHLDMGGQKVKCPLCMGTGRMKIMTMPEPAETEKLIDGIIDTIKSSKPKSTKKKKEVT